MSEPFVVSIHIPKTAGTTLADILSRCYRRVFYDYDGYENLVADPDINLNSSFIRRQFEVLHGHFLYSKYADMFPDAKYIATLRHPVERTISQYVHELNEVSSSAWYHDDIVSGRMDIVTFAAQDGVRNAMSAHLRGRAVKDYDLLLISEHLWLSVNLFKRNVKFIPIEYACGTPPVLPHLNATTNRAKLSEFSDDLRTQIFNKTAEDCELYREASEIFHAKVRAL